MASESPKSAVMSLRIQQTARELIDRAALAAGKNRTEFIINAACREAEAVLLDRRLFSLSGDDFDAFSAALDRSPTDNSKLRRLLDTPPPWEQ